MKTLQVLFFGLLGASIPAHAQWTQLSSGTAEPLSEIYILDENAIYAGGGEKNVIILQSENAGQTWSNVFTHSLNGDSLASHKKAITSLVFTSPLNGIAITFIRDTILRSADGGKSWTKQYSLNASASYGFPAVSFVSESLAYAPGYKSTDGGNSWLPQDNKLNRFPYIPKDIHFFNEGTGLVAGYADWGEIYKTQDSGMTWHRTSVPDDTWEIYGMHFPSDSIGYAISHYKGFGDAAEILKTFDGGENWSSIYLENHEPNFFKALFCTDTNTCYVVGNKGLILISTDGGDTWEKQNSGTTEDLYDIKFLTKKTGYITGNNGTILKTSNGGKSAIPETHFSKIQHIFPNPSSGIFNFSIDNPVAETIEIVDALGHLILSQKTEVSMRIDLSTQPSGIYYYRIIGKTISTGKLIKN